MNETIITAVITGVVAIVGAVFGPGLWEYWTSKNKTKTELEIKEIDMNHAQRQQRLDMIAELQENNKELELSITHIKASVNMLLMLIEDRFKDDLTIHGAIKGVREQLYPNESSNSSTGTQ